ncbi:MAG: SpoIIE family protein phosphatase, partial [bacterium]
GTPCPPAGVLEDIDPNPISIDLYPGDVVVLYTDGISRRDLPPPETVASLGTSRADESLEAFVDRALERFRSAVATVRDDVIMIAIRILARASAPASKEDEDEFESPSDQVPSLSMPLVSP